MDNTVNFYDRIKYLIFKRDGESKGPWAQIKR